MQMWGRGMARVNVETRALAEGRFTDLVGDMDSTRAETIGFLVLFWHDTQERGVWKAPRDRLIKFIPFAGNKDHYLDLLIRHEYVSECSDGEFVVHGNRKHIDALGDRKVGGREGGIRSGETRREKAKKSTIAKQELQQIEAPGEPNSIQCNAVQSNSMQSNSVKPKPEAVVSDLKKGIEDCLAMWERVKRHHGIERKLLPNEEAKIGAAIQRHGRDPVLLAFEGARAEKPSESFNPADHLSLTRIFDPLKFERFVNLGAKSRAQATTKAAEESRVAPIDPNFEPPDPEKVRKLLASAGFAKRMPRGETAS
ncbi:MAG: hypothetical protein ACXVBW_03500 [Bdellovibrionota bacterium]